MIGRFTSADPTLQYPYNPQDLTRYSYALNNPLSFTDPSGYGLFSDVIDAVTGMVSGLFQAAGDFVESLASAIGHGAEDIAGGVRRYWKPIAAVVLAVYTGGITAMAGYSWAAAGGAAGLAAGASYTALNGGSVEDIIRSAAIGALFGYSMGAMIQGAYAAATGKDGAWGLTKWFGNQGMAYEARSEAQDLARKNGMSLLEFDAALFGFSEFGNWLVGSRFTANFEKTGKPGITGFLTRPGGVIDGGLAKAAGFIFDVSDTLLAYQGIPTASGFAAMMSNLPVLQGHSLGSLDVGNLQALGSLRASSLYAVPFGFVAPGGSSVENEWDDPISGFFFGLITNPDAYASMHMPCHTWVPHSYTPGFSSCGG